MVEIRDRREVSVHHDVAATVDSILRGAALPAEIRTRLDDGSVAVRQEEVDDEWDEFQQVRRTGPALTAARARASSRRGTASSGRAAAASGGTRDAESPRVRPGRALTPLASRPAAASVAPVTESTPTRTTRIYPFGVSRNRIEGAIRQLNVPATIVRDSREADIVLTLKNYYRRRPQAVTDAEAAGIPIYVLRSNTSTQIEQVLGSYFHLPARAATITMPAGGDEETLPGADEVTVAIQEAEEAINTVMNRAHAVELAPQSSYIRRLQHQLAERYNLGSRSRGREPNRRVQIYRSGEGL
jgi:hypothetical protein